MSYALRRSLSSCSVVLRWTHLCLTAPSRCNGHPTGIRESSRSPSPFCSMTVPNSGTSMVVLRLMCGRLHCHVSAARSPRLATSAKAKASKLSCSRRGRASSCIRRSPCMGSRVLDEPSAAALATVSSSNHVGRRDFTPIALLQPLCVLGEGCGTWGPSTLG